jgi:hypothetical protein
MWGETILGTRGYANAKLRLNYCLFTIDRSEERLDLSLGDDLPIFGDAALASIASSAIISRSMSIK